MKSEIEYTAAIDDLARAISLIRDVNTLFPAYRIHVNPLNHKLQSLKLARDKHYGD